MPLVNDDGDPLNIEEDWSLQTPVEQQRTLDQIDIDKAAVEDEVGPFSTDKLWTGRVLVKPRDATVPPLVAYMHDKSADARLVLDEFIPELLRETWESNPKTVKARKPKNLEV